ncbi:bifunctional protein-serine/threonine kinase/phosphatase [Methylocystis bryophila]|uniref:bifunctional protein-serine/threonine kinase/phosphatase n=1 Tax=Methylocystis bryophila TaxID=655015 RepID=UPI001FDA0303|nr:bifunctional protein-serine/threonine kinase/phosphatase [Methylocystis bryophila]BDV38480.1 protein kinase [Methylocystis bryophila]
MAAVADGVGGHKGGREAAETCVRGFIDAYYAQPETLGVARAASRALESINAWIAAQARVDSGLAGMATTFSALIFSRRTAFLIHVGDSRAYRLRDFDLELLTSDHVLGRGELSHALLRAVGFEETLRVDNASHAMRLHDRFLLCSDGVHGPLRNASIRALLSEAASPQEAAERLVSAALEAGGDDNATALVADLIDLPPADEMALARVVADLPIESLPRPGEIVDDYRLEQAVSDGRYSRLLRATDLRDGSLLVLKFPHPRVATDASYRRSFVNEAWVAARVRSPFIGEIVEAEESRRTRLYSAMPFYDGETLEARLRRAPKLALEEGVNIATRLARAVATLHRAGIIHRDVKPDNVMLLKDGGLRLIDLGVCRAPRLEDFCAEDVPGTPSYMAPELFLGAPGDEASDLYALGVTIYRAFTGDYPYGEIEPFSRPRFGKPRPIGSRRPDLPAWLDAAVLRAVAVEPRERYGDVLEFAFELENGVHRGIARAPTRKPLYERNPVAFWRIVSLILLALLFFSLLAR